ncbi:MAG: hypothetical protein ACREE7_16820, partial [Dongiaceae bacterium]
MVTSIWLRWLLTALGFPIGGGIAYAITGPAATIPKAMLAGAISGAAVGLGQWLVLRQATAVSGWWIAASAL